MMTRLFLKTTFILFASGLLFSCGGSGKEKPPTAPTGFVEVEGGSFTMGSTPKEDDKYSEPQHQVTLSTFTIGKYEVTNAEYAAFLNEIGVDTSCTVNGKQYFYFMKDSGMIQHQNGKFIVEAGKEKYPACRVSWYGANAYAQKKGGRLPTEAEWEFAARGGKKNKGYTYSGSNNLDSVAWHVGNSTNPNNKMDGGRGTHPVGTKAPNALGLYDMSGNVCEWVSDRYGAYGSSAETDPQGPSQGDTRVYRGGSWFSKPNECRCSYRYDDIPDYADEYGRFGFRIVLKK